MERTGHIVIVTQSSEIRSVTYAENYEKACGVANDALKAYCAEKGFSREYEDAARYRAETGYQFSENGEIGFAAPKSSVAWAQLSVLPDDNWSAQVWPMDRITGAWETEEAS